MKQPNFKKSILDYFENRKKTKKTKTPKNKKIGGLMSSLSDSAPTRTKRITNRKEKERRFIKYHMTPLTKSDAKLNFKPSPYNVPEMETQTNQNIVPESKSKEKVKTEIRSKEKSKSKQNNTTPIIEKRTKESKPIVTQNRNKERYTSVDIESPLNDLRKSILSIIKNKKDSIIPTENKIIPTEILKPKEIISNKAKFLYQEPEKKYTLDNTNNPQEVSTTSTPASHITENHYSNPIYNKVSNTYSTFKNGIRKSISNDNKSPRIFNTFSPTNRTSSITRNQKYVKMNNTEPLTTNGNQEISEAPCPNTMTNIQSINLNNKVMNLDTVNKKMNSFIDKHFSINKRYQRLNSGTGIRKLKAHSIPTKMTRTLLDNQEEVPVIPGLAKGGIVTQPTPAIIGEAGPEVAAPLKDLPGILSKSQDLQMQSRMPIKEANTSLAMNNALKSAPKEDKSENGGNNTLVSNVPVTTNNTNMGMAGNTSSKFSDSTHGKFRVPAWRSGLG